MKAPLYVERVGWVGFGRASPQLDLFESTWRLGWWRLSICKVCLIARFQQASDAVAEAVRLIEQRRRDFDGR